METQKQKVRFGDFVVTVINNGTHRVQVIHPLKEEIQKIKDYPVKPGS